MNKRELRRFVKESNRIEGIKRLPTEEEIAAHKNFLLLQRPTVADLKNLVYTLQPGAKLRIQPGMDVTVGRYTPPRGGPVIAEKLAVLLTEICDHGLDPWAAHIRYESLHPFMDGNGRSGRALWLWQMKKAPLGFLHKFYYQTLDSVNRK